MLPFHHTAIGKAVTKLGSRQHTSIVRLAGTATLPARKNLDAFRREGLDPHRMNDDHGTDFQTTRFRESHPECRLDGRALDFNSLPRFFKDAAADGSYLFNFFTTRGAAPFDEPPFGALATLGDPLGGTP